MKAQKAYPAQHHSERTGCAALPLTIVISCEHAGYRVPAALQSLFVGKKSLLHSHRGWDAGALPLARAWARQWQAPLFFTTVSRLVCDTNRKVGSKGLWSACTAQLEPAQKKAILQRWHSPHRQAVYTALAALVQQGLVLHLAAHSFTPVLHSIVRTMDIGLLYDPARQHEQALARHWQQALHRQAPHLIVRRNAPYRGAADGLPTWLRKRLPPERYYGFEVECNQALLVHGAFPAAVLAASLEEALVKLQLKV
jgi:predicted N-formylglutamate amidohydrolase